MAPVDISTRHRNEQHRPDAPGATVAIEDAPSLIESNSSRANDAEASRGTDADASVYLEQMRSRVPEWARAAGPAPWLIDSTSAQLRSNDDVEALHRRMEAALALAIVCELDPDRPDVAVLRELVRVSLLRWQIELRSDGLPRSGALRRSPLHAVIASNVVLLLCETTGFQTTLLLRDIARHLRWLARRRPLTPWLESARICALADGAVLAGDHALRQQARAYLARLLKRQNDEGWFPECGGPDLALLSLTVDALARTHCQNEWPELEAPLERSLTFLSHFVRPDGRLGGCFNPSGVISMGMYGVEVLSGSSIDVRGLTLLARRGAGHTPQFDVSLCLAATCARDGLDALRVPVLTGSCHKRFGNAGWSVFATERYFAVVNTRTGGSVHVTWHNGTVDLDDPGVTVLFPHRMLTSGNGAGGCRVEEGEGSVTVSGFLRRAGCGRLRPSSQRLSHDRFRREITFGETSIRIRDEVHCRLPCQTIVCQSRLPSDEVSPNVPAWRVPIFVDGGRHVEVTRTYREGELASSDGREGCTPF